MTKTEQKQRRRVLRLMRKTMEAIPAARPFIDVTMGTTSKFLSQFGPPGAYVKAPEVRALARELCAFDVLTRLHQSSETNAACTAAAMAELYKQGWRLKVECQPLANELNAMNSSERAEWFRPHVEFVEKLRVNTPSAWVH